MRDREGKGRERKGREQLTNTAVEIMKKKVDNNGYIGRLLCCSLFFVFDCFVVVRCLVGAAVIARRVADVLD